MVKDCCEDCDAEGILRREGAVTIGCGRFGRRRAAKGNRDGDRPPQASYRQRNGDDQRNEIQCIDRIEVRIKIAEITWIAPIYKVVARPRLISLRGEKGVAAVQGDDEMSFPKWRG